MSNTDEPIVQAAVDWQEPDRGCYESEGLMIGLVERDGECECPFCKMIFRAVLRQHFERDNGMTSLRCNRCGYEWRSRTGDPSRCPKCGSSSWNRPNLECKCYVCSYEWVSRKIGGPSRCPNCKSSRWNQQAREVEKRVKAEETHEVRSKWIEERYDSGQGCLQIASELGIPLFSVMDTLRSKKNLDVMPRLRDVGLIRRRGFVTPCTGRTGHVQF